MSREKASCQPTISRFGSRLDEIILEQLHKITCSLRKRVYSATPPQRVLLDLDSTLLPTYGKQEGETFNYHYSAHGHHPLVCYDGLTGDLLKIELRKGSAYSSTEVVQFLQPLLDEYLSQYPDTQMFLRGDSGFATMSSHSMLVNENRLQICMLTYKLFNWFRRLCLPRKMKAFRADTIRLKLLKIAGKLVTSARSITFKLCSSCPYIHKCYETFENIGRLTPKLEEQ